MLRLADLEHLPRPGSGREDRNSFDAECRRRGVDWPPLVTKQFLYEHGDKDEFLVQYGHLDLRAIRWELRSLSARSLMEATVFEEFDMRVRDVATDPHGWLDRYSSVYGTVWTDTWAVPPLLIEGGLRRPPQPTLHLMEGHTRVGVLFGLVDIGEISIDSPHDAFVASLRSGRDGDPV